MKLEKEMQTIETNLLLLRKQLELLKSLAEDRVKITKTAPR